MEDWRHARAKATGATSLGDLALLELAEHEGTPRRAVISAIEQRAGELLFGASEADKADALAALSGIPDSKVLQVIEGRPSGVADDDVHGAHTRGTDGQPSVPGESERHRTDPVRSPAAESPARRRVVGRPVKQRHGGRIVVTGMADRRRR